MPSGTRNHFAIKIDKLPPFVAAISNKIVNQNENHTRQLKEALTCVLCAADIIETIISIFAGFGGFGSCGIPQI